MTYKPETFSSAIVVVGNFNPAIFSPDWLEKHELIGKDDAASTRDESNNIKLIVSNQVATFETEWFVLQVFHNQFSLSSKGVLTPAIKDLVVGVFQLLSHTPVNAVGLNFMAHYKFRDESEYHKLGDVLAPKDIWNELYRNYNAGLANLTIQIQDWVRGENLSTKDEKRISIQPSKKIRHGAFLSYNDHHDLTGETMHQSSSAERLASIVDNQWDSSWKDAERVFGGVLAKALEERTVE